MSSPIYSSNSNPVFVNMDDKNISSNKKNKSTKSTNHADNSIRDDLLEYNSNTKIMIHYYESGSIHYRGKWLSGVPNGKGTMYNEDGSVELDGYWENGEFVINQYHRYNYKENIMEVIYEDGNILYRGGWSHGVPEGNGKYYMNNGKVLWKGEWHNGLFKVKDNIYYEYVTGFYLYKKNGHIIYRGQMNLQDEFEGKGIEFDENGNIMYDGDWKHDEYDGIGKEYVNGVLVYEGEWKQDFPYGRGIYYENGKEKYKGKWVNGYYHVFGTKWFNYDKKEIETYLPVGKKFGRLINEYYHSVYEMGDDEISCKSCCFMIMVVIAILIILLALILMVVLAIMDN